MACVVKPVIPGVNKHLRSRGWEAGSDWSSSHSVCCLDVRIVPRGLLSSHRPAFTPYLQNFRVYGNFLRKEGYYRSWCFWSSPPDALYSSCSAAYDDLIYLYIWDMKYFINFWFDKYFIECDHLPLQISQIIKYLHMTDWSKFRSCTQIENISCLNCFVKRELAKRSLQRARVGWVRYQINTLIAIF